MHDELFNGYRLRLLTIVDSFSGVNPAIGVKSCYQATGIVETLTSATEQYGIPKCIRVDNDPEFVAKGLDLWAYRNGVTLDFSRSGKPKKAHR